MSAALLAVGCSGDSSPTFPTLLPFAEFSQTDVRVGTGADAAVGQSVTVHFTGWLFDPRLSEQKGQQFDTSVGREALTFTLGLRGGACPERILIVRFRSSRASRCRFGTSCGA